MARVLAAENASSKSGWRRANTAPRSPVPHAQSKLSIERVMSAAADRETLPVPPQQPSPLVRRADQSPTNGPTRTNSRPRDVPPAMPVRLPAAGAVPAVCGGQQALASDRSACHGAFQHRFLVENLSQTFTPPKGRNYSTERCAQRHREAAHAKGDCGPSLPRKRCREWPRPRHQCP